MLEQIMVVRLFLFTCWQAERYLLVRIVMLESSTACACLPAQFDIWPEDGGAVSG
jgi:hypothetical protein